nr:hypothetical protein [Tanacetum cinerariifolium]
MKMKAQAAALTNNHKDTTTEPLHNHKSSQQTRSKPTSNKTICKKDPLPAAVHRPKETKEGLKAQHST